MQCSLVFKAFDLRFKDAGFKTLSDHWNLLGLTVVVDCSVLSYCVSLALKSLYREWSVIIKNVHVLYVQKRKTHTFSCSNFE